jgi:hypothetical protein
MIFESTEQISAFDGIDIQLVTLDKTNNKASCDSEEFLKPRFRKISVYSSCNRVLVLRKIKCSIIVIITRLIIVVFEILALCKRLNERRRAFVVDVLKQNT